MSIIQATNIELHTRRELLEVKYSLLADPLLIRPGNSLVLCDGEWLTYNSANKLVRATDATAAVGTEPAVADQLQYIVFTEPGRTDEQASAEPRKGILYHGAYTLDTRVFDASQIAGNGAAITRLGQGLKVATIQLTLQAGGVRKFTGLVGHGGAGDSSQIVARVDRLPATNGGKLRIIRAGTF